MDNEDMLRMVMLQTQYNQLEALVNELIDDAQEQIIIVGGKQVSVYTVLAPYIRDLATFLGRKV